MCEHQSRVKLLGAPQLKCWESTLILRSTYVSTIVTHGSIPTTHVQLSYKCCVQWACAHVPQTSVHPVWPQREQQPGVHVALTHGNGYIMTRRNGGKKLYSGPVLRSGDDTKVRVLVWYWQLSATEAARLRAEGWAPLPLTAPSKGTMVSAQCQSRSLPRRAHVCLETRTREQRGNQASRWSWTPGQEWCAWEGASLAFFFHPKLTWLWEHTVPKD